MWITADVELPMELVEAHSAGNLVLFVGAGASRNPPSELPLFEELAEQIGAMAHQRYPGDGVAIDRFLGELLEGFDVHKHVGRLINRPGSMPNENHRALVRLAASAGFTRIITTNFDEHLQAAARDAGEDLGDTYYAPALPVGREFTGLAHLHGSITRPARELVLTDHDFGRAYLTDAWATRFLREVFDYFVVLFVGFSHNDPIINYLGMGLPSSTRRFILTDVAQDPRWKRLGITPVAYPGDNNHAAAARAIDEWAKRASMGRLDHRARIRDIVQGGPPKNPVETDYLSQMLEDPQGAREFADSASGEGWLPWLEKLEVFSVNFTAHPAAGPGGARGEASAVLAHWFCDKYIADPSYQAAALSLIQRTGQQLGTQLVAAAPWALRRLAEKDQAAARRWTVLLTTSVAGQSAPRSFDPYLDAFGPGEPNQLALRQALHPRLKLRPDYWADLAADGSNTESLPAAELAWPIEEYAATKYWQALKKSGTPFAHRLCSLFENALLTAHELLEAWSPPGSGTGALTAHRSAIERHPQDKFRKVLDVLIDGLRDCGEELIVTDPGFIERWWSFEYPLFRRLALHLLGRTPVLDPAEKLQWLLDRDLVFDYNTKHETYAVLKITVQDAGPEVKAGRLERIVQGPQLDYAVEARHVEYMKYNVLVWIAAADPAWTEAATALVELQAANPDFAPREHPDFDRWFESGVWGGTPPASTEEFTEMIRRDGAESALGWLLTRDYSERTFDEPTWDDALGLLRTVAETEPSAALELWETTTLNDDDHAADIRRTLIYGWSRTALGNITLKIVENAATLTADPEAADAISVLLAEQVTKQADVLDSRSIVRLQEIARRLWQNHHSSFTHEEEFDPTMLALNSWPGRVARYWVKEISRRWQSDPDGWSGLNEAERDGLLPLLHGSGPALDATRPAVAGEVFFMFAADPDFTVANIFPLFSTAGLERQSWEPYLYHPRWNNRFLESGFLELTVKALPHIDELTGPAVEGQYWNTLTSVIAYSDIGSHRRTEILDDLVLGKDGHHIVRFIDCLAGMLEGWQPDEAAQSWDAWIGRYMQRRFDGQPRRPVTEELEAWADLIPFLGSRIPAGVEIVLGQRIGFRSRFDWNQVPATTIHTHAVPMAQYLTHRLQNSSPLNCMTEETITEAGNALIGHLDADARKLLVEAAAEHGITLAEQQK